MKRWVGAAGLLLFAVTIAAHAHVTVWPRESRAGAHEKYTVRVPTEGDVATVSVELQIPDGVEVVSMAAPAGYSYELKKTAGRITGILWTMRINPGEFAEFAFMARNPAEAGGLTWKAVQRFADGTKTEWTGPRGDRHPASVTSVVSAPAAPHH